MSRNHLIILFVLVAFRFWLLQGVSPNIIAGAMHDDGLFASQAFQIARGSWLGVFNELTLIKGVGFPIFLALNYYLGLPALISLHLLLLIALLFISKSLIKFGLKPIYVLVFLILSFYHPIFVTPDATRITRDFFYSVLLALWISILLQFLNKDQTPFLRIILSILGSILFAWLLITREEGIWLLPFCLFVIILTFCRRNQFELRTSQIIFFILTHLICVFAVWHLISKMHQQYYGEKILTEFQDPTFKRAYASLLRPKDFPFRQYVPVSKNKREALYNVSPSFRELKPYLENPASGWISPGCAYISPCDDLSSHFIWAFREAVSRAGYYKSISLAKNYYRNLIDEIDQACTDGRLSCNSNTASLAPPFNSYYLKPALLSFWRGVKKIFSFEILEPFSNLPPAGEIHSIDLFARFVNHSTAKLFNHRSVRGWATTKAGDRLEIFIESPNGKEFAVFEASPDILEHHQAKSYGDHLIFGESRFSFQSHCSEKCYLNVYSADQMLLRYRLDTQSEEYKSEKLTYIIEYNSQPIGLFNKLENFKIDLLKVIAKVYFYFIPILSLGILLYFLISLIRYKVFRPFAALNILLLALLVLLGSRLLLLSYLDVTSFEGINNLYLMPIYVPFLLFLLTMLACSSKLKE